MMHRRHWWLTAFLGVATATFAPLAVGEEPPAKALKYHSVLVERPQPGYLFDRFYNAWLDEASVDSLAAFLNDRAQDPGESADGLLLAFFYAKQGDDRQAIEQFRATLADDPGNAAAWFEKAVIEARTLDFQSALSDLEAASKSNPNNKLAIRIAKLQGQLLVRNRQRDQALEVWQALLDERPDDEELAEDLIELKISEGLFEQAAEASRALIERTKDPYQNVVRRLRLGDIHQQAGSRTKALETYRSTLDEVGFGTWLEREILAQIEQVFRREDDVSGLKGEYEKLCETYPNRIGIRRGYANVLAELNEHDAAVAEFEEILKLTPGDRGNREAFISLLTKADKRAEATRQLAALIEQHPDDAELYVRLAHLHHESEHRDEAAAAVDKFLAASDKSEYSYLRAARLLEEFELFDQARAGYARLVEAAPDSIAAREAQAAFLYRQDEKEAASEIWRELADTDDANQIIRVAKTAVARHENELAYELLVAQRHRFEENSLFLAQLVDVALALKNFDEAIPWARQRVELAETASELESALVQAGKAIDRAEKGAEVIEQLQDREELSVAQTCLLAELLESIGDSQQADRVLADLGERGGLLAVSEQIRLASLRRDWASAAEATRRLIELPDGRKSQYVRRLVEYYQRDFRIGEALTWIDEWKKLSPGSISPWLVESRLLLLDGKDDEAIHALRSAAGEFEDSTEIRVRLAQLYTDAGKLADAERIYWQQYEESEELGSKLRWVEQLARIAEQQGKGPQLVEQFEERRRTNRGSIVPLLALAQIHHVMNNYEGRRQALTAATKIKPDDLQLLLQIARIEQQEGDWQRARDTLERAAALDKTNRTRQRIARLHIEYGNPEDGFAMLYDLAGGDESDPRDIEAIADAMCGSSEWERAEQFLLRHVAAHPTDYRLEYLLAVAENEQEKTSAAIESFTRVLDLNEELPGVSQPATNQTNAYWSILEQIVPRETIEMIQLSQLKYTIQRHRQQRYQAVLTTSYSGGLATSVSLPSDVQQAHQYALANLMDIAQFLDERETELLVDSLERRGVRDARVLIAAGAGQTHNPASAAMLVEQFPDHPAVLAYAIVTGGWGRTNIDPDVALRAYETFRESRPQLAIIAALAGASRAEDRQDLFDEAMQMMADVDEPNTMLMMNLCGQLGGMPGNPQGANNLPEKVRQALTKQLLEWYPKVQNPRQYGTWMFMYVLSALRGNETADAYVTFLEDEVARQRMDSSGGQQAGNPYVQTTNQFLEPPSWPPQELADFPKLVLQSINPNGRQFNPFGQQTGLIWDDEVYLESVEKAKDPILKVLLLTAVDDTEEEIEQLLGKLQSAETPMLDALLLAAAWEADQANFVEASRILDKARYLPMTRALRRMVDGALVVFATEHRSATSDDEKLDDDVWQAGRQAALRLRHNRLQPDERLKLVAALEELALSEEAEKLDRQSVAAASSGSPAVAYRASTGQQTDRIQKLIDQDKREVAARALANELMALVRQATMNSQNAYHYRYQYEQLERKISGYGMIDEVLDVLDPKDARNFRKIGDFAMANEILGRRAAAIANYRKLLELRPNSDMYRVKLLFLLVGDDSDGAAELLDGLGKQGGPLLALELAGRLQQHNEPVAAKLDAIEVAILYLQGEDPAQGADLSWLPAVCGELAAPMHQSSGQLPSLYAQESQGQAASRGASEELLQRRRELHDQLCRGMLAHPSIAQQGFTHLLAAAEAAGEVDETYVDLAVAALLLEPPPRRRAISPAIQQIHINLSRQSTNVPFRSPAAFLVRHCFQEQDWSVLDDRVLAELSDSEEQVEEITELRRLYECPADEFLDVASEYARHYLRKANRWGHSPSQSTQEDGVALVVDAWSDRKLDVDLLPLVRDAAETMTRSQTYYQPAGFLIGYSEALARLGRMDRLDAWLEAMAELHVGPKEKREELIKKHYNRQRISWGTPNGLMYVYGNLLGQMLRHPDLVLPTIRIAADAGVSSIVQNYEHYSRQGLASLFEREPAAIVDALAHTRLLADFEEFDPYLPAGEAGDDSGLQLVAVQVRNLPDDRRKQFAELLDAAGEGRVGARTLAAVAAGETERQALIEDVGEQLDRLQSLDADQQSRIAIGLYSVVTDGELQDDLSPAAKQAMEWMEKHLAAGAKDLVQQTLEAKRLEELQIQYYQVDQWLANQLPPLAEHSPEQAVDVFFKMVDLVDESQQRNRHGSYYGQDSLAGALLARTLNRSGQGSLSMAAFGLDVFLHERGKEVELPSWGTHNLTNAIRYNYDQIRVDVKKGAPRDRQAQTLQRIEQWHAQLGDALGDRPSTIYGESYANVLQRLNTETLDAVIAWAEERGDNGPHAALARELAAAAQLVAANKNRGNQDQQDRSRRPLAPYHEHYLQAINDASKPPPWRLAVAKFLYDKEREQLPLEVLEATIDQVVLALKDEVPIDASQQQAVARSLLSLMETDPSVRQARAAQFATAWQDRFLRTRSARQRAGTSDSLYRANNSTTTTLMLKFYLELDDENSVNQLLRTYENYLSRRPDALAMLVRAGLTDRAAQLLRRGWSNCELHAVGSKLAHYDELAAEKLPDFYESIHQDDLRYFAQALMASLEDPEPLPSADFTPKEKRQEELAKRFAEIDFKSHGLKRSALLLFTSQDMVPPPVARALAEEAGQIDLVRAATLNHNDFHESQKLVVAHLKQSLGEGDAQPAVDVLDRLLDAADGNEWQIRNATSEVTRQVFGWMRDDPDGWSSEVYATLAPITRKLATAPQELHLNNPQQINTMCLSTHLLGGLTEEFSAWAGDLNENDRQSLDRYGFDISFIDILAKAHGEPDEANLPHRVAGVQGMIQMLDAGGWLTQSTGLDMRLKNYGEDLLQRCLTRKLLSKEELLEHGPQIAEAHSARGFVWASLAVRQQQAGQWQPAARSWQHAVEEMPAKNKKKRQLARLNLAGALFRAGQPDDARQAFAEVEPDELASSFQKRYNKLKESLAKAEPTADTDATGDTPQPAAETEPSPASSEQTGARLLPSRGFQLVQTSSLPGVSEHVQVA